MQAIEIPPAGLSRRTFLQVSAAGSLVLGAASMTALLTGCERQAAVAQGFKVLRPQDLPILTRLLPAVLDGALPVDAAARAQAVQQVVASFDQLLVDTSASARAGFLQLLDLFDLGIVRGPLLGLWKSWKKSDEADAAAVLERLGGSSIGLLRGAYNGMVTMAMLAWYLEPAHQAATGYPGPPRKIVS
ncbi:MAG: twin-arginine translocation pathway signal protein [Pseudomonadota bacterium]